MKKSEATGLVVNPRAIATRCETSFLSRAPQRCGGQSTGLTHCVVAPDERFTDGLKVGAEARRSACFETSAEGNHCLKQEVCGPIGTGIELLKWAILGSNQ